jgi:hypothetical protein
MKGRETLGRSHNGLNTANDHTGLTESFSASIELLTVTWELKSFVLRFLLLLSTLSKLRVINPWMRWAY